MIQLKFKFENSVKKKHSSYVFTLSGNNSTVVMVRMTRRAVSVSPSVKVFWSLAA